jgi:hypothetical protein
MVTPLWVLAWGLLTEAPVPWKLCGEGMIGADHLSFPLGVDLGGVAQSGRCLKRQTICHVAFR